MELTRSEMEIMDVLWEAGKPLSRADLLEHTEEKTWKDSSVHILLNSLLQKGAIQEAGLEKRGKTYLNSFCFGFRPSEKIDSYYLAYMLRSESAREKIILLAQGISRYNISKNKVMEIAVSLPSLDEQKLIGQYFRQLDNLITLHHDSFFSFNPEYFSDCPTDPSFLYILLGTA